MYFRCYRLDFRAKHTSVIDLRKRFCGSVISLGFAEYSNVADDRVLDDYLVHHNEGGPKGIDLLHSVEARSIRASSQTYVWLLKGYLSSGSVLEARKLHSRIVKLGYGGEDETSELFVGVYIVNGDLCSAVKVFEDLLCRSLFSLNNIIYGFLAKKLTAQVLGLFSRMVVENVHPDETMFAGVLRACAGGNGSIHYVEQIHARIIHHGFGTSLLVCNPLIDLYAKNGIVNSAKKVFDKLEIVFPGWPLFLAYLGMDMKNKLFFYSTRCMLWEFFQLLMFSPVS